MSRLIGIAMVGIFTLSWVLVQRLPPETLSMITGAAMVLACMICVAAVLLVLSALTIPNPQRGEPLQSPMHQDSEWPYPVIVVRREHITVQHEAPRQFQPPRRLLGGFDQEDLLNHAADYVEEVIGRHGLTGTVTGGVYNKAERRVSMSVAWGDNPMDNVTACALVRSDLMQTFNASTAGIDYKPPHKVWLIE